jgi:hypothetical protein
MYFHANILILIDLMEESYSSRSESDSNELLSPNNVAVLLFFCTLKEALFENFLRQLFNALRFSRPVQKKLLDDNRLFHEKIDSLLPALIEEKWTTALDSVGRFAGKDFRGLNALLASTARTRNAFLHDASPWSITATLADSCVDALSSMIELFVALHNYYVHRKVVARCGD